MTGKQQDQLSKLLDELSTLVQNIFTISTTSSIEFPHDTPGMLAAASSSRSVGQTVRSRGISLQQLTPSAAASFLFGVSLLLMVCGSVAFFLGFMLMPGVIGLIVFLYVAGIVSSLSMIGRSIFCSNSTPSSPRKQLSVW